MIAEKVNSEWVQAQMQKYNIRLRDIQVITQHPRQQLSNWITGHRRMSLGIKCMFYLFFRLAEHVDLTDHTSELVRFSVSQKNLVLSEDRKSDKNEKQLQNQER